MECGNKKPNVLSATCPSRQALDLIADKWTVMIIYVLGGAVKRYSEIHREVGGISQKVLTATLRKLERSGIVHRKIHPIVPPKVEYSLTPMGKSLIDILTGLSDWAEKHLGKVREAQKQFDKI